MKKIVVLCAHEPHKDPRVGMIVDSLAKHHDVKLIAAATSVAQDQINGNIIIKSVARRNPTILMASPYLKFSFLCAGLSYAVKLLALANRVLKKITRTVVQLIKAPEFNENELASKLANSNKYNGTNLTFLYRVRCMGWLILYLEKIYFVLFKTIPEGIDCIYANDLDTLMPAVAYKLLHPKCEVVYDCHEFYPYSHNYPPYWYSAILINLERALLKYVDKTITINPMLAQLIGDKYKIEVYSLLNATPVAVRIQSEKADVTPHRKRVNFLLQGNLRSEDGMYELIEAWEELDPQDACLFIRAVDGPFKNVALDRFGSFATFNKSLFFIEPVFETELIEAAMPFDIGIIPYKPIDLNYKYCCPNKFNQYLHAGLAILANKTEFVASVVRSTEIGLIYDSSNKDTIKKCLNRFVVDAAYLQLCKENARLLAQNSFNWQVEEQKLLELMVAT